MKLAILGTDSDILQLAAAARSERHEIVWCGDIRPDDAAAMSSLALGLHDRGSEWELLLDRAIADAVLVGRGAASNELRAERVKRLATEGMPLLIVHPAFESVLTYYEVDMTRRETGAIVGGAGHGRPAFRNSTRVLRLSPTAVSLPTARTRSPIERTSEGMPVGAPSEPKNSSRNPSAANGPKTGWRVSPELTDLAPSQV